MNPEWMDILQQVKSGKMAVGEAAQRLEDLENIISGNEGFPPAAEPAETLFTPASEEIMPDLGWWKEAWLIPFWAGTGIFVFGAVFAGWLYSGSHNFWFACSWLLFLFGMLVLFLGWWSRQARWVHVCVQEASGSRVAISLPLPLRLSAWVLRGFVPFIPKLREKEFEPLPDAIEALASAEGSLSVEVDEEDGQRVRVYFL